MRKNTFKKEKVVTTPKVYSSRKITLSEEEKTELLQKINKQLEKQKRDSQIGGMDGCCFVRLHNRHCS